MKTSDSIKVSDDPMRAFSQGDTLGRILTYCECVKTETKLLAEALVNRRDIDWVERVIANEGCRSIVDRAHSEDYAKVYLFKHSWVRQILEERKRKDAPKSALNNWITGKLFGYSGNAIAEFLREKGLLDAASK